MGSLRRTPARERTRSLTLSVRWIADVRCSNRWKAYRRTLRKVAGAIIAHLIQGLREDFWELVAFLHCQNPHTRNPACGAPGIGAALINAQKHQLLAG